MDPFDLIAKIPPTFEEMLMSKKWIERKEAIESLVNIASKYEDLDPKVSYHRLCDQLKQVGFFLFYFIFVNFLFFF